MIGRNDLSKQNRDTIAPSENVVQHDRKQFVCSRSSHLSIQRESPPTQHPINQQTTNFHLRMGSLCQCIARFCCDEPPRQRLPSDEDGLEATGMFRDDEPPSEQSSSCCPHTQGIHDLLRRLRDRFQDPMEQRYDIMPQQPDDDETTLLKPSSLSARQALTFDATSDIPCIASNEIVLPGSKLQKEMAAQMVSAKLTDADVECVICMEPFDDTNPRMPTLCGCGENKTFFHLPCLYQWLDQNSECPSCREKLTWEEF